MSCIHDIEIQFFAFESRDTCQSFELFFTVQIQEPVLLKIKTKFPGTIVPICH